MSVIRYFVYGQPHEGAESDWYLQIDVSRDVGFSLETMSSGVINQVKNEITHAVYDACAGDDKNWDRLFVTDRYFSAQILLTKQFANRNGWYQNRNGGMCPNLHKITKRRQACSFPEKNLRNISLKEVRISRWPK